MTLSIYGASGIIGSNFTKLFGGEPVKRNEKTPLTKEVLYLISTTSNFYDHAFIHGDTNITCLLERLEACANSEVKIFNFVSSWFVYGQKDGPMSEDDTCEPNGLYSITKRCAEQLVVDFCNYHGIYWRIFRLPNVYGGPDISDGRRNALHFLVQQLVREQAIYCVKGITRDYMHIDDVCSAIDFLCNNGDVNSIYNIGSGKSTELAWCLNFCKDYLGSGSEIMWEEPKKGGQSLSMALDCSKIFALGFSPSISLEDGLEDLCTNQKFCTPAHFLTDRKSKRQWNAWKAMAGFLRGRT